MENKDILIECFSLYRDENFNFYGTDDLGNKMVGFYNRGKINPLEPDLRLYYIKNGRREEKEFLSLWCKEGRTGRKYLIGNAKDGFCYIGLINFNRLDDSEPYLKICYKIKNNYES